MGRCAQLLWRKRDWKARKLHPSYHNFFENREWKKRTTRCMWREVKWSVVNSINHKGEVHTSYVTRRPLKTKMSKKVAHKFARAQNERDLSTSSLFPSFACNAVTDETKKKYRWKRRETGVSGWIRCSGYRSLLEGVVEKETTPHDIKTRSRGTAQNRINCKWQFYRNIL